MRRSDVQSFVKAQIDADGTLGPLNAVNVYDPFVSQETERAAIDKIIRATGFCIQIGRPFVTPNANQTNNGGVTFGVAHIPVFIAEDRNLPHTPKGDQLVDYVEAAINSRNDNRHISGTYASEPAETDDGLIITQLVILVRIQLGPQSLPVLIDAGLNQIADSSGNTVSASQ